MMRELAQGVAAVIGDFGRLILCNWRLTKNATAVLIGAIAAEPSVTQCGRLSIGKHLRGPET
jgi:hypothetical protein